jgi:very-short-patch-repair endonuclease
MDVRRLPVMQRQAALAGAVTRRRLEQAIASGAVVCIGDGVVVGALVLADPDPTVVHAALVTAALMRAEGEPVGSHGSAALLHGLSRLGRPSGRVRLTRAGGRYRRMEVGARIHVAGLPREHVTTVHGTPVTTMARTVVDLARTVSFRSGVVVADSAMRLGCRREELEAVLARCRRWPGIRRAREVVRFARAEAETPLESISRVFFRDRGLPEPELQVQVGGELGPDGRVDFYWRQFGVVGESDGLVKYDDDPTALRREKLRHEALEDAGFTVVRWTWEDVWRFPDDLDRRIRRAFSRAARAA